ncbi:MAG: CmpA/NrtA family ABC transporter substrate-binding protein [Opitutales bacterium]
MVNAQIGIDMTTLPSEYAIRTRRSPSIRLGYVRLLDAAPLIVAERLGLFRQAGLEVALSREVGWATIRDKLAFGDLDVAQALSPMPFAMQLGIGVVPTPIIAGMVLNCNGNAITLSRQLGEDGVEDGPSLRRHIRNGFGTRKPVFGVVSLYSSHHFVLCRWLEENGIDPREDVIVTVLPPEQMVRNIASENIDGFCVGEPWNSLAVEEGFGWCPATSAEITDGYPEKVLATTERFETYRPHEYAAMIGVLMDACAFCDDQANHRELLNILSPSQYLNCSPRTLSHALSGSFPMGHGRQSEKPFVRFHGDAVNRPDPERMRCVLDDLCRFIDHEKLRKKPRHLPGRIFRESIYDRATDPVACQ